MQRLMCHIYISKLAGSILKNGKKKFLNSKSKRLEKLFVSTFYDIEKTIIFYNLCSIVIYLSRFGNKYLSKNSPKFLTNLSQIMTAKNNNLSWHDGQNTRKAQIIVGIYTHGEFRIALFCSRKRYRHQILRIWFGIKSAMSGNVFGIHFNCLSFSHKELKFYKTKCISTNFKHGQR